MEVETWLQLSDQDLRSENIVSGLKLSRDDSQRRFDIAYFFPIARRPGNPNQAIAVNQKMMGLAGTI
jgi:hypothetical protein